MRLIQEWIISDKHFICFPLYRVHAFDDLLKRICILNSLILNPLYNDMGHELKYLCAINRFPAGIFGFKNCLYKSDIDYVKLDYKTLFLNNTNYDMFKYGIDEVVFYLIFFKLLKLKL